MTDWRDKYGDSAIYRLNKFIREKLESMTFINLSDYKTDLPNGELILPFMVPGQDNPEMVTIYDQDKFQHFPYIVYSVSQRPVPDEPYLECGQASYTIYHVDIDILIGMVDYLNDLLKREDWTARDINTHFMSDNSYSYDFKSVSVLTTAGPAATDEEGGRNSMLLVLRYDVTYEGPDRNYTLSPGFSTEFGMR